MVYTEYKEAVERHLEVCLRLEYLLRDNYKSKEDSGQRLSTIETKEKLQLLCDLYYLTGYIIECGYNYAIYKHINFPHNEPVKNLKPANWTTYRVQHNVSYTSKTNGGNSNTFLICRANHTLDCNMHFFADSRYGNLSLSIPLIDGNNITRPCTDLYQNWIREIQDL